MEKSHLTYLAKKNQIKELGRNLNLIRKKTESKKNKVIVGRETRK